MSIKFHYYINTSYNVYNSSERSGSGQSWASDVRFDSLEGLHAYFAYLRKTVPNVMRDTIIIESWFPLAPSQEELEKLR